MDYTDEEDIITLFYTTSMYTIDTMSTLDEFRSAMTNEKIVKRMAKEFERETKVTAQFNQHTEVPEEGVSPSDPSYIRDIVATLIMSGLNASYAMDEMELCDLPIFLRAYEQKRKEQLESDRLWTYFGILPHVDGSKIPTARDMYPFPWEQEEMKAEADREIQANSERLEQFFKEGKNLIMQNYGK